jgi:hypothetical protein
MNPWDIDPSLYAALWRLPCEWYLRRQADRTFPHPADGRRSAGCRT